MNGSDLETLRHIFKDDRLHIALSVVKKVSMAADKSVLRVLISILPEQREIVARMTWSAVGESAGFFSFPNVGDLVLTAMAEGDESSAFVISRLTSKTDKIPATAVTGDMVAKALAGKKLWLTSDTRINLSKGDTEPTENLVLGQVFKTMMSTLLQALSVETHICMPPGYSSLPPDNKADYLALKSSPVDNEDVLSDVSFTEKGS